MNATPQMTSRENFTHQRAWLPDGRLHLSEGPIDLVIGADGDPAAVRAAFAKAERRFAGLLSALVLELPILRAPVAESAAGLSHPVAKRMHTAVSPHRDVYVTPMAAVAGAVADEILNAMAPAPGLTKAYVNNGGDIALHLAGKATMRIGAMSHLRAGAPDGTIIVTGDDDIRGVATSGAEGRSFSLGIADSVTVLARDAATADVAATLIGNAVNIEHEAIQRAPANSLDPDSDLRDRLVTVAVGELSADAVSEALENGVATAQTMLEKGLMFGALLNCRDQFRIIGHYRPQPKHQITLSVPAEGT